MGPAGLCVPAAPTGPNGETRRRFRPFSDLSDLGASRSMTVRLLDDDACDFLIAADFTRGGDRALRLAEEIRALAAEGRRPGLVQARKPDPGAVIAPEVQTCIRRGLARVIDPMTPGSAARIVVHEPASVAWDLPALGLSRAREVILVCHRPEDLVVDLVAGPSVPARMRRVVQRVTVNPFLREIAEKAAARMTRDWLPMLPAEPFARGLRQGSMALGWCGDGVDAALIGAVSALDGQAPPEHFLMDGRPRDLPATALPPLSLDRLIAGIDMLVVCPSDKTPDRISDLPDTLIAAALASGIAVVLPDWLEPHYGRGPRYAAPGRMAQAVQEAMRDGHQPRGPAAFVARCRKRHPLLATRKRAARPAPSAQRPILCLAANGVGVGHLTRLLAIARRFPGEVVFASQVPALEILDQYGFQGDYIPSAATVGGDFALWDGWFGAHLTRLLDRHDPALVVYDGNHPSWGLVGAVAARRDCRLAWMRRGMWADTTSPHLRNARWCDMVIEPGELAAERDRGITAALRHEARQVEPIRLLEEEDLLPRAEAAAALGLDPRRPAVLVQLGSGYNRDLLSLIDQIVAILARHPGLQIAVAEWVNGTIPLALWPRVKVLRGFPISQYLRAFDFCISAAGYNSFHELIGFAVPTIFVANRHPTMDDQYGRAKFAQDSAAAFEISTADLHDLPDLVALLLQDQPRDFLRSQCRKLSRLNGAAEAARLLHVLSHPAEGARL